MLHDTNTELLEQVLAHIRERLPQGKAAQITCAGYLVHPFRKKGLRGAIDQVEKGGVHVRRERAWLLEGGMVYCSARVLPVSSACFQPEDGRLGGTEHISAESGGLSCLSSTLTSYIFYFVFYK